MYTDKTYYKLDTIRLKRKFRNYFVILEIDVVCYTEPSVFPKFAHLELLQN